MNHARSALALAAVALGVVTAGLALGAQEAEDARPGALPARQGIKRDAERTVSIQEALQRPFIMPFGEPTTLTEVCRHLRMILKAPVVLDLAALKRQELTGEDTVRLELHGVRLKTGLKLLLDQVELTFQVVPEDNLLIVTDAAGSADPLDQVLTELKAVRRDLLDLQDSVDEVRATLGLDAGAGPKVRKPTIIEERPDEPAKKPANSPDATRRRPGA